MSATPGLASKSSKALIRSAKLLSQIARAQELGIRGARADFDFAEVMERVQRVVRTVEPHDSIERYTALGVEVIEGAAKIVTPWEVEIARKDGATQRLTTRSIVIATGGRPLVPDLPGLDETGYLTSDTVWNLRELPRRYWWLSIHSYSLTRLARSLFTS